MPRQATENPILNTPYDAPSRYWRFDDRGVILPEVVEGRRSSESWVPIPRPTKTKQGTPVQGELELGHTAERRRRKQREQYLTGELIRVTEGSRVAGPVSAPRRR